MTAAEGRGRRPTIVVALALIVATALIALFGEPFAPMLGVAQSPVWVDVLGMVCSAVSLLGGTRLIVGGRPATGRTAYFVGVGFATVGAAIPLWFGLFVLVNVLAVVMTVPYALGLVGLVIRLRRS